MGTIVGRNFSSSGTPMKICVSYPVDVHYLIIYTKKNRAKLFQCNDIFNSHELRLALNSSREINFALPFSIFFFLAFHFLRSTFSTKSLSPSIRSSLLNRIRNA